MRQTSIASWDAERMAIIAAEKLTRAQAAVRFGVSERTVYRIVARAWQTEKRLEVSNAK